MKKLATICICVLAIFFAFTAVWADPSPPVLSAESAVLIDAVTGKVLFEKNSRKRRPPASTTKMMTAILALESGNLADTATLSAHACKTEFGNLHGKPGEKIPFEDLLYALLLRSANDGAVCVAEHIAGTESKFVEMMNAKAKEVGANDTHFMNPHGLYKPNHYSTAYDLALIARYAIRYPKFNEIVATRSKKITRSINQKDIYLRNTARFLKRYEGADGIKTGYVKEAGHCFVGSATRDGWRLIAVVLKSKDSGADTATLLNYAYKYYKQVCFAKEGQSITTIRVKGGVEDTVDIVADGGLARVLRKTAQAGHETKIDLPKAVSAPVKRGEKIGTLTGYLNGEKVGSVNLVAASQVDRTFLAGLLFWVRIVFVFSVISLLGYVSYGTAVAKASRRRRIGVKAGSGKDDRRRSGSRQWSDSH